MARPRDPEIDDAVLMAARHLLQEVGYQDVTIDAIARRAGVGRPAIYRRWNHKADIMFDAVRGSSEIGRVAPVGETATAPDTGSLHKDVRELVGRLVAELDDLQRTSLVGGIVAEMAVNPEFAERMRNEWLDPDEDELSKVFERAAERGEIDGPVDGPEILRMIAGIVLYHVVILQVPYDDGWEERVTDVIVGGVHQAARTGDNQPG